MKMNQTILELQNTMKEIKSSLQGLQTSLAVVRISPSSAGSAGSIPGQGAKISHISWPKSQHIKKKKAGTSLVVQWLRICLPLQGA